MDERQYKATARLRPYGDLDQPALPGGGGGGLAEAEVQALKEQMRSIQMDMLLATEGQTRAQKAKATEEMKKEAQKEMEALKMEAAEGVVEGAAEAM